MEIALIVIGYGLAAFFYYRLKMLSKTEESMLADVKKAVDAKNAALAEARASGRTARELRAQRRLRDDVKVELSQTSKGKFYWKMVKGDETLAISTHNRFKTSDEAAGDMARAFEIV